MTLGGTPVRTVVVVGGGIVGWSAAAALKRRVPALDVTILPCPPAPNALAERVPATLPSIGDFHADLGLGDEDAVLRTGSSYRLGTMFDGWPADGGDYVHAYGPIGCPLPAGSFHLNWVREARTDVAPSPFDAFSAAAALARAGRFVPPSGDPADPFAHHGYGLHLDLPRYGAMMRAFAGHCGVREQPGELAEVRVGESDHISGLALAGGQMLHADMFLDCTGPAALLRSAIDDVRDDWRDWLPCDCVMFGTAPAEPPSPLDWATAWHAGWHWRSSGLDAVSHGIVYASAFASDADAGAVLRAAGATPVGPPATIASGTRREPWRGNCVAVGEAATATDPLEWTNLHIAHNAIDRLIAMLPDATCAPVEAAEYNRQTVAEAGRVRDFLALHYAATDRPEPFWRDCATALPPASLAHTLTLFRERGRLPLYEEETFSRDSWLSVLLGQGVLPRRVDPLVASVAPEPVRRAMDQWRTRIHAEASARPTLPAFLAAQHRRLAR